ncbi:MAG: threonine synthase [Gammaproteobacteria bacterium CG22_combo_CG10-13_8_21_14_all_40_8]|nr:MAG: threonine synthase [Gammaproteobacteria bacterium CG22_combo_CG10-13_8_21_14_all_40_8]
MKYISTRGHNHLYSFEEAVLRGLAMDGGLLVPQSLPDFSNQLDYWTDLSYQQLAFEIMFPFVENCLSGVELKHIIEQSYAVFDTPEITPLTAFDGGYILELYHGPTFAFKDIALQFLGNLFDHFLGKSTQPELNIVGATSGDTGSAAIYAVKGKENVRIFMLHPKGKISPVQALQMTTVLEPNVYNIAIEGDFDDCQSLVKALFNDEPFRKNTYLGAVNSINWARILAQVVYYFYAGLQHLKSLPDKPLFFSVPTGNFGDAFAGYLAKKMGLPIQQLIVATNENAIVARVIQDGRYSPTKAVATLSPAMDIQVSSNFERLLFYVLNQDGEAVLFLMNQLQRKGCFELNRNCLENIQKDFCAYQISNEETLEQIQQLKQQGIEIDPHTAVGVVAAIKAKLGKTLCLATAHPAKFKEAFVSATGVAPEPIAVLEVLKSKESRCATAPVDVETLKQYMELKINETNSRKGLL